MRGLDFYDLDRQGVSRTNMKLCFAQNVAFADSWD